jgi:GNAT superfamily N-acetyltransferase
LNEITYVEDSLEAILNGYPYAKEMVLSKTSSMSITLAINDGERGWYGTYPKVSSTHVVLILEDGQPIGWSWIFGASKYGKRKLVMWVYIDEDYRRQGHGSTLYDKARERATGLHRSLRVEPWDERSRYFFGNLKAKSRWNNNKVVAR